MQESNYNTNSLFDKKKSIDYIKLQFESRDRLPDTDREAEREIITLRKHSIFHIVLIYKLH